LTGKFKTYQGTHAVTKESEWYLQVGKHNVCYGLHEKRQFVKRPLRDAVFTTGKLNRADIYFR